MVNTACLYDLYEVELEENYESITFISPSNVSYNIKTFMKSNNKISARCYINESGTWKYKVDGKENIEFICNKKSENLHGKLKSCGINNRKFKLEDGTPYNMLGFECDWLFHIDDENNDIPKASVLLNDIAENEFNMVICNLWANDVNWASARGRNTCYDFSSPNETPYVKNSDGTFDYDKLNYKYFDRIDKIFNCCKDLGIIIHLMIYVWNKLVPWPELFSKQDDKMFEYVFARYSAYPNLMWDISKEALNYVPSDKIYKKCKIARKLDPFNTVMTVHDDKFCRENPDCVDVHSIQNWNYGIYNIMLDIFNSKEPNPVLNIEHGGYEKGIYDVFIGSYQDPYVCLERNYIIAFAGAYSTYYWEDASWNIVIWNYKDLLKDFRPKYEYYKYFHQYLNHMNYQNAYPTKAFSPCDMCMDDGTYYYYLKLKGTRCVTLKHKDKYLDKQTLEWFNPLTNEYRYTETGTFKGFNSMCCPFGDEFSILRIKHN